MRTRNLTIAAVAALSLLAACGSDSKGAADTTATTGGSTPTSDSTATSDTSVKASGEHADEEFCQFQETLNNVASPLDSSTATPDEIKSFFTDTVQPAIAKLTETAPDAMAADAATMADAYTKLSALFEKNEWDLTTAIADPDLATLAGDQNFSTAASNIDTYCGFSDQG
ncbi:MAG: hypothetical protein ACOYMR_14340 [Ilumatobacteraceae bacterium]